MKYLSICDGIGAAHVAWKPIGWECVGASEIAPAPKAVVKQQQPNVPELGDMTKYHEWKIERPDLVCGGTPCQSFSVAGLRKGMADPRGNLSLIFLGIVDHFRPRWVVWENVPGVLSSNGGRDFGAFIGGLGQLGYGFAYRVLDAQYFGLAQRRKRVFVVGHLGDWRRAAAVLFEQHSLQGYPAPSRGKGQGVAATITSGAANGGPGHGSRSGSAKEGNLIPEIAGTMKANSGGGGWSNSADHAAASYMVPVVYDQYNQAASKEVTQTLRSDNRRNNEPVVFAPVVMAHGQANAEIVSDGSPSLTCNHEAPIVFDPAQVTSSTNRSNPQPGDPCHTLHQSEPPILVRMREGKEGGGKGPLVSEDQSLTLATANDQVLAVDAYNYDTNEHVSASISTMACHNRNMAAQGMQVRRLTPRETERLQGFPDDYTLVPFRNKPMADGPRYKGIGNSWAVPVVNWIGRRIDTVEELEP